jgi:gamma-glutamylputrescine oxidase
MTPSAPIWYEAQPPPYPRFPGGRQRVDVAVIGGGFAGLSAAYHLLQRQPGLRVVVLEAERLGAGASGRTTGMLSPGVGQNLAAVVRRFGTVRARALYRATLQAIEDVRTLITTEGIHCQLEMNGQLIVARSQAGQRRVAATAALLQQLSLPGELLNDETLNQVIRLTPPAKVDSNEPAALRLPIAGTLHPIQLLAGLAERVSTRGGTIFEGARVIDIGQGQPVQLTLSGGGTIEADSVVAATAGYTPNLGLLRGRLLPVHLQVLVTEPLTTDQRQQIGWAGREGIVEARRVFNYFRLTTDNRIVFGGGAPRYCWGGRTEDSQQNETALTRLTEELHQTFPGGNALRVAGGWTGVIGYTIDTLPAIHRARENPAVIHVVGWCGHGVALALASGAWITHMLCDRAIPEDLPWYRNNPPLVPFEPIRWVAFRTGVGIMALQDRLE